MSAPLALAQITPQSIVVVGEPAVQSIVVIGDAWIARHDRNQNGVVNYNEFRRAAFEWFFDVDTDADDVIEPAEYEAALRAGGVDQKQIGAIRDALFKAADPDRDRKIGYYELSRLAKARFAALDPDRDRQLGPNELRATLGGAFDLALNPRKR